MPDKKIKQDLKEKSKVVEQILSLKGVNYDEWQLQKHNEFISENAGFLVEMASKNATNI